MVAVVEAEEGVAVVAAVVVVNSDELGTKDFVS